MMDLSQATKTEQDLERIKLLEPKSWYPPILRPRSEQGRHNGAGWTWFFVGIFMTGLCAFLLLSAYGFITLEEGKSISPKSAIVLNLIGFPMYMGILFLGWLGIKKEKQLKKNKLLKPNAPWFWEFNWDPKGIGDDRIEQIFWRGWIVSIGLVVLGPTTYFFLVGTSIDRVVFWVASIVLIPLDLFYLDALSLVVYHILQYLRYGKPQLNFQNFPFFSGGKVNASLAGLPHSFSQMIMNLRFIEEVHESSGTTAWSRFSQLYKETKIFTNSPANWDGILNMEWNLPDNDSFITKLNSQPAQYWELEVIVETSGIDYKSRFLLPVYANQTNSASDRTLGKAV